MSESHSKPKVLVAGFFDMLHSGHIRFFEEAAKYGRVIVSLGSDDNSLQSKGKKPVFSEEERKYMVESIKHVHKAYVPQSTSTLNFTCVAEAINPDFLVINEDGDTIEKREIQEELGMKYVALQRLPEEGLGKRSSTDLRRIDRIPRRLDIVDFFDQVFMSKECPGSTVMCGLEPMVLEERSGMASSTRKTIKNTRSMLIGIQRWVSAAQK